MFMSFVKILLLTLPYHELFCSIILIDTIYFGYSPWLWVETCQKGCSLLSSYGYSIQYNL